MLGAWGSHRTSKTLTCPETLEIRHLINYKELSSDIRNEIIEGINQYGEYITRQQEEEENMRNIDERNEEDKIAAQQIKEKVSLYFEIHITTLREGINAEGIPTKEIIAELKIANFGLIYNLFFRNL